MVQRTIILTNKVETLKAKNEARKANLIQNGCYYEKEEEGGNENMEQDQQEVSQHQNAPQYQECPQVECL
jgi:hypothetical protein